MRLDEGKDLVVDFNLMREDLFSAIWGEVLDSPPADDPVDLPVDDPVDAPVEEMVLEGTFIGTVRAAG